MAKKYEAFSALLNLDSDPLKTYLAFQKLPQIFEESFNLQAILEERFYTIN